LPDRVGLGSRHGVAKLCECRVDDVRDGGGVGVEGLSVLGVIETVTGAEFDDGALTFREQRQAALRGGRESRSLTGGSGRPGRVVLQTLTVAGGERVQGVGDYGDRKMQVGGGLLGRGFAAQLLMQIGAPR